MAGQELNSSRRPGHRESTLREHSASSNYFRVPGPLAPDELARWVPRRVPPRAFPAAPPGYDIRQTAETFTRFLVGTEAC